jgi:succinyl-CoA synthetase beta subunit
VPLSLKFMPLRAGVKVEEVKNRNPLKIKRISIVKGYALDKYTKK